MIVTIESGNVLQLTPLLHGMAISEKEMLLGNDGLKEFKSAGGVIDADTWIDGRFFACVEDQKRIRILTDPMGQDTLYVYAVNGPTINGGNLQDWIVSNSFLSLTETVKANGLPLSFNPTPLAAGLSTKGTGFGAQLFSCSTSIRQILVLPIGCEVIVEKSSLNAKIERVRSVEHLLKDNLSSFEESLAKFVAVSCARLKSLSLSRRFDLSFDLSGGHDSRALVGMGLKAGVDFTSTPVFSNPKWSSDFKSASLVSEAYGFELTTKRDAIPSAPGAYDLWKYGSLGVYNPVYAHGAPKFKHNSISVHGGNFLSKEFGSKTAREWGALLSKKVGQGNHGDNVESLFLEAFEHIGVDPDFQWASHLHYINFRSRFHYGRNWVGNTRRAVITPLISPLFSRAAFKLSLEDYNELRPCMELLLAIDNKLCSIPFDHHDKDFNVQELGKSLFFGEKVDLDVFDIPDIEVYGSDLQLPEKVGTDERKVIDGLMSDLERYGNSSVESGVATLDLVRSAKDSLQNGSSVPHGGRLAAIIISAGTFWELSN